MSCNCGGCSDCPEVKVLELKGEDGLTPYIGENGNWYIGDTDTGVGSNPAPSYELLGQITFEDINGAVGLGQVTFSGNIHNPNEIITDVLLVCTETFDAEDTAETFTFNFLGGINSGGATTSFPIMVSGRVAYTSVNWGFDPSNNYDYIFRSQGAFPAYNFVGGNTTGNIDVYVKRETIPS